MSNLKDSVQHLASLVTIANYVRNNILAMGRSVIDQKTFHALSAKLTVIDKMIAEEVVKTQFNPNIIEEEPIDIKARLEEAKKELEEKKNSPKEFSSKEEKKTKKVSRK